jgi:hypothetical protein
VEWQRGREGERERGRGGEGEGNEEAGGRGEQRDRPGEHVRDNNMRRGAPLSRSHPSPSYPVPPTPETLSIMRLRLRLPLGILPPRAWTQTLHPRPGWCLGPRPQAADATAKSDANTGELKWWGSCGEP